MLIASPKSFFFINTLVWEFQSTPDYRQDLRTKTKM